MQGIPNSTEYVRDTVSLVQHTCSPPSRGLASVACSLYRDSDDLFSFDVLAELLEFGVGTEDRRHRPRFQSENFL